jgi:ABC-type multidrug transport system ATPase subunit
MTLNIVIKNCNNIDDAKICLHVGRLNLKYGPNGIGKSTLAKALTSRLEKNGVNLLQLQPFKYRGDSTLERQPSVGGADAVKSVAIFNEEYIEQFAFQRDEVVKNSFEIFVRNAEYDQKMKEIEALVAEIKDAFTSNEKIDEVIRDLQELGESFGKSQSGISKAGRLLKGLGDGNKVEHVPERLNGYKALIRSSQNVSWIKWQIDGKKFLAVSENCPFCTVPTDERKETILAVGEEYDAKSIEHLLAIQGTLGRLGDYFSAETREKLKAIVTNKTGLKKEEVTYLLGVKKETDTLREKLMDAKNISFFSLRDAGKVTEMIGDLKVDLSLLPRVTSEATASIVNQVNSRLDLVLGKAGQLEGEVNKQKSGIEKTIKKYRNEINKFLRFAGYRYAVDIQPDGAAYKMKLRHLDSPEYIENGGLHLSYGERNAFSIVLFMYECLTKPFDLIVLDDPISSFDDTKKFAILQMLFRGKDSLQGKTVLMLTHDIEPVIDLVKTLGHTFQPTPVATFLISTSGKVEEIPIDKTDVLSFTQICAENMKQLKEPTIQLIYLRRNYELSDDKGDVYHLLSSLLHQRVQPTTTKDGAQRPMTKEEIDQATNEVKTKLPGFDYAGILAKLTDKDSMLELYQATSNRYMKLQLFRIIHRCHHTGDTDDVVQKYINETFHIENEYIMQLNPHKYDSVPEYIVLECDRLLGVPS